MPFFLEITEYLFLLSVLERIKVSDFAGAPFFLCFKK
jgi:hypothetical protein